MKQSDSLQGFMFENLPVRGQIIRLEKSYMELIENHDYPGLAQALLGQFAAAAGLLSSNLKFSGKLILQAQGQGPFSLVMAECQNNQTFRGIARYNELPSPDTVEGMGDLFPGGQLAITIDPEKGERYQGIVPLEQPELAECIDYYFAQSEQLPTRIWLGAEPNQMAYGLLLQVMPQENKTSGFTEEWERLAALANTLTSEEMAALDNTTILRRLFNEDDLRLFEAKPMQFACTCSRERTLDALISLGRDELQSLFAEDEKLSICCEFCKTTYEFDYSEVSILLAESELSSTESGSSQPSVH